MWQALFNSHNSPRIEDLRLREVESNNVAALIQHNGQGGKVQVFASDTLQRIRREALKERQEACEMSKLS